CFVPLSLAAVGTISIGCYYFSFTGLRHIVINEICSNNGTAFFDDYGETPDYIELYNKGILPCGLSQVYLSDDAANLKKQEIPLCEVPAGGYVLVELDKITFSLKKTGGETVFLSDSSGHILDSVTMAATDRDYSYARQPDGGGMGDYDSYARNHKYKCCPVDCRTVFVP
ncbi:MAG: lamin tail domain-containing protein, partial [Lachnospiraceae bacterium]|nr:lamin tail domain-containing protein [Lachnospiraceae bacterium]